MLDLGFGGCVLKGGFVGLMMYEVEMELGFLAVAFEFVILRMK